MARTPIEISERMAQRIKSEDKRVLIRAAALSNMDLSRFVVEKALSAAYEIIEREERIELSVRDGRRVMELLENPPPLPERFLNALKQLPAEQ